MSHRAIALLILAPTPINFATKQRELLIEPEAFGVIRWQGIPPAFEFGSLLLQLVDLPSGACLPAIKPTGVEEHGSAHLLVVFVHGGGCQSRVHTPVCSQHA